MTQTALRSEPKRRRRPKWWEPGDLVLPARLPLDDLEAFLAAHGLSLRCHQLIDAGVNINGRVRSNGYVTWEMADRVATALRTHPSLIWSGWFGEGVGL